MLTAADREDINAHLAQLDRVRNQTTGAGDCWAAQKAAAGLVDVVPRLIGQLDRLAARLDVLETRAAAELGDPGDTAAAIEMARHIIKELIR